MIPFPISLPFDAPGCGRNVISDRISAAAFRSPRRDAGNHRGRISSPRRSDVWKPSHVFQLPTASSLAHIRPMEINTQTSPHPLSCYSPARRFIFVATCSQPSAPLVQPPCENLFTPASSRPSSHQSAPPRRITPPKCLLIEHVGSFTIKTPVFSAPSIFPANFCHTPVTSGQSLASELPRRPELSKINSQEFSPEKSRNFVSFSLSEFHAASRFFASLQVPREKLISDP